MAQIGARLIDATAKSLADQFFTRFAAAVGAPPPVDLTETEDDTKPGMMGRVKGLFGGKKEAAN